MTGSVAETRHRRGRIVIVGASLAGLRAAETLRKKGFRGKLTLIGEEPHEPYDRPPLSKQVLTGYAPADQTALPRLCRLDAEWRLGVAAVGVDLAAQRVHLADGQKVGFDRIMIATGRAPDLGRTKRKPLSTASVCCARAMTRPGCGSTWPSSRGGCSPSAPGSSARKSHRSAAN
ncbi:pyridine nucleotide-disulfide oxidoreductase family protein [Mycobacterium kansasii]|uniref:Pyridine nucleotide-disulfide oxidoreductase family protein n=1 Tax=Mycobacterium kansasii TaxID=1768 RepID=A0A1V3XCP9_MYCKA|nr:pyridine nucleotide-disulfide oxidoreductase family protein [Mycobacterium kansasii]